MKKLILLFIALTLVLSTACSGKEEDNRRILEPNAADMKAQLDINSPEGLAKASSQVYIDLVDGKLSVEDAVDRLSRFASQQSRKELDKQLDLFKREIRNFQRLMADTEDSIVEVAFSKTVYEGENDAYIERAQKHKSGKIYYFRQNYVRESGKWKIGGDNITDPFKLGEVKK